MYILPPLPSATSPGPQKPADVAGPPSPNSLPPPATLVIIPNVTSAAAGGERCERDAVELAVFAGFANERRFSSPPHATTTPEIATISNRDRWRTRRQRCARLHKQVLSKPQPSGSPGPRATEPCRHDGHTRATLDGSIDTTPGARRASTAGGAWCHCLPECPFGRE